MTAVLGHEDFGVIHWRVDKEFRKRGIGPPTALRNFYVQSLKKEEGWSFTWTVLLLMWVRVSLRWDLDIVLGGVFDFVKARNKRSYIRHRLYAIQIVW